MKFDKGIPIRAIMRGLAVLQLVNQQGPMTMMDVARKTNIPYPTASRILQTLVCGGWVERIEHSKKYRATGLVRTLAAGFHDHYLLEEIARRHMSVLGRLLLWPVSLCTRVGLDMIVQYSTHAESPLTYDFHEPGFSLPIFHSAAGKAYIAFAEPDERQRIIDASKVINQEVDLEEINSIADAIRNNGYAGHMCNQYSLTPGKTSSIAVPVLVRGRVIASISVVFFSTTLTVIDAAKEFLEPLNETAQCIANDYVAQQNDT